MSWLQFAKLLVKSIEIPKKLGSDRKWSTCPVAAQALHELVLFLDQRRRDEAMAEVPWELGQTRTIT